MSPREFSVLTELVRERLLAFLALNPEVLLPLPLEAAILAVARIVERNLENGRFTRYAKKWQESEPLTLSLYIDRVIQYWAEEYSRVKRLEDGNREEWDALVQKLEKLGRHMLFKYGSLGLSKRSNEDVVQETIAKTLGQPFPFEIKFDSWIATILNNVVFGPSRSRDGMDWMPQSLDEPLPGKEDSSQTTRGDLMPDDRMEKLIHALQDKDLVTWVFEQMQNPKYVAVLKWRYIEELSVDDIANRLKCRTSYVYVLSLRAARRFCEILENDK